MASVFRKKMKNGKRERIWRFKYKDHTGRWRYGTGWPDKQKTHHHALELEAEHRAIRNGEKPQPSSAGDAPIQEVIAQYMAWGRTQGGRGGRPWATQNAGLKQTYLDFWVDTLSLTVPADVRLTDVEAVIQELLKSGDLAPKSVALRVEALRSFCIWAARREYLDGNPLVGLAKIDTTPRIPHRALTEEEIQRLLEVAPPDRRLWYEVALMTGFRVSELRALRVGDLDVFGPSLALSAEKTKNRKAARQPITREMADTLAEVCKGKPHTASIFAIPTTNSRKFIGEDFEAADIPRTTEDGRATWHSLRKSFVDAIVRSGADVKTVMELARHSTASLTMETYASAQEERLREAVNAAVTRFPSTNLEDPCCVYVENEIGGDVTIYATDHAERTCSGEEMVGGTGLEPVTPCMSSMYSNHLS